MRKPKVITSAEESVTKETRRECDLAEPITTYLKAQGYTVRSEVHGCDITALLGEELVVIELKRHFSTDLLVQAIERQHIADSVYVALPVEGEFGRTQRNSKRWKGVMLLLKRLEVGLIVVVFPEGRAPTVEVVFHPLDDPKPRKKPKKRRTLLREIAGRSDDYNVGGSVGRELLTAYREQAIYIALLLERFGPLTPAGCRNHGASPKTQTILHRNVYGWFDRRGRGLYALRPQVIEHLGEKWPHVVAHHDEKINAVFLSTEC